jgi:hypothetical protein
MGGLGAHRPRPSDAAKQKKDSPAASSEVKSPSGKTARDYLQEIKEKILQYGGPDIIKEGWQCKIEMVAQKDEGSSEGAQPRQEAQACYISPSGEKYTSRKEVMRKLGLKKKEKKEHRVYSRDEAYTRARRYFKQKQHEDPTPVKIEGLTIRNFGRIDYDRDTFHDERHIWPVGFKSSWKDTEENTLYESEILDGATTKDVGLGARDAPIFMVTVKKTGAQPVEYYGTSPAESWKKARSGDKSDHFGLSVLEVRRRIEGLKHADNCKHYRFIEEGPAVEGHKQKDKSGSSSKGEKKTSKGKEAVVNKAVKVKDKIEKEHKTKEKKDAAAASKKEQQLLAKEKKEEAQRKAKEEAAAKRKASAEEAAKKRKEQELEKQWQARYPIEDLALGVELEALREAENEGCDVAWQRAAAKAAVEAIERGYKSKAALYAARTVTERIKGGISIEEAIEVGLSMADDVSPEEEKDLCPYLDPPVIDDEHIWAQGSAVRMLFSDEEIGATTGTGTSNERWYNGWLSKYDAESKQGSVSFFEGETVEVKLPDNELQLLPQGPLCLPHGAPMPMRASSLAADAHTLMSCVESFRGDLSLPKGNFTDLIQALYNPASGSFLSDLYFSLLKGSMQAASHQSLTVPSQWLGESTLTPLSWPEVLRRWIICGPYAPIHR